MEERRLQSPETTGVQDGRGYHQANEATRREGHDRLLWVHPQEVEALGGAGVITNTFFGCLKLIKFKRRSNIKERILGLELKANLFVLF